VNSNGSGQGLFMGSCEYCNQSLASTIQMKRLLHTEKEGKVM
jgi:hypothetical protein